MAVPVFLILCSLSVGFLVYVLVQFRREARRPQSNAAPAIVFTRSSNPNLIVVTHPVSLSAQGGISVMPLQPQTYVPRRKPAAGKHSNPGKARVLEMPPNGLGEARHGRTGTDKLRNSLKVS